MATRRKRWVGAWMVSALALLGRLCAVRSAAIRSVSPAAAVQPTLSVAQPSGTSRFQALSAEGHVGPRIQTWFGADNQNNWCGYAVGGSKVTDVKGTWTVPVVALGSGCPHSYSTTWVGIDGANSRTVEQLGTAQEIDAAGQAIYYAWFEMWPDLGDYISVPSDGKLQAGDNVTAEVTYQGQGHFLLQMWNNTRGWHFETVKERASAYRTSAEWIVEAPTRGGVLPLANFGSLSFTGCGVRLNDETPLSLGQWVSRGDPSDEFIMVNSSGGAKATPSGPPSADGAFSVTWGPNCQ
jgi:hypothetical protein